MSARNAALAVALAALLALPYWVSGTYYINVSSQILFYAIFHRDNLVGPMVTGYRKVTGRLSDIHAASRHGNTVVAVIVLALAVGAVYLAVNSVKLFGAAQ